MQKKVIKIVHILEGFTGGLSTYACAVLPQLVQNGFDVTLVCSLKRSCPDVSKLISELRKTGVKVYTIPMARKINPFTDIYAFIIVLSLLLKNRFDIVHTHCSKAGVLGRLAAALTGVKIRLHSPHCFAFMRCGHRLTRLFYLFAEKLLGKLTTRFVAVSQSEAQVAINSNIAPYHKCVVVENGLSINKSSQNSALLSNIPASKVSLGFDKDTQIITTACRLVEYKGIFRFLEAARISNVPNVVFLIAGDGKLKTSAENFISENKLGDRVKLLGHISNMEEIYAISDVVVLCSDAEAQPYLLLEAMRAKCPIVATSVIGNKELISHEKTGFLVEPTPVSIATAIDKLLTCKNKRNELAENAYAYFCEHHTLEKQILKLIQVYKTCIGNENRQHATAKLSTEQPT